MKSTNNLLYLSMIFVFCIAISGCKQDIDDPEIETYTEGLISYDIEWEGRDRDYEVYFPKEEFAEGPLPILFVLHGGGGDAKGMRTLTFSRFNELADMYGFLVVYPNAFEKQWNEGRLDSINTAIVENINDVGFIAQIVAQLQIDYNIDDEKIYTSGISNGGFMSSRLLCDRADLFRGGAIVTATLPEDYINKCNPSAPVSVITFNGTGDFIVPYEGGQIVVLGEERGEIISTDDYISFWNNKNNCTSEPEVTALPNSVFDGTSVTINEYNICDQDSKVHLYKIENGGHTWPGGFQYLPEFTVGLTCREINACDLIVEFFNL